MTDFPDMPEENRAEIRRSQEIADELFEWFEASNIDMKVGLPGLVAAVGIACSHAAQSEKTDLDEFLSHVYQEIRFYALLHGTRA
jgi:hypothetical protein